MNPWLRRSTIGLLFAALMTPALAKKEDPLDRMTPVPADQPIPVVDFFRPRLFTNPELNPAGTHFAAIISTKEDRTDLIALELATKKIERLSGGGGFDIYDYDWLGDRRLVFSVTKDKLYSAGLFAAELGKFSQTYVLQRRNAIQLVGFPRKNTSEMVIWIRNSSMDMGADGGALKIDTARSWRGEEKENVIHMNGDDGLRADIRTTYPAPKGGAVVAYISDREGELAYAVTSKEGKATLHRLVGDKWEPSPMNLDKLTIAGVGDVPDELLVYAKDDDEKDKPKALFRCNAATGEKGEKLFQDDKYDIGRSRIYRDPVDRRILGIQYTQKGPRSVWFDPGYAKIQAGMERTFPNDVIRIIGSDREQKQFFVVVSSDLRPASYYRVDVEKNQASAIADSAPWIDPKRMQPMRIITYKARDGKEIEGYVTLPAGASKEKPVPLVVLPHGGPWVRDNWGWDPQVQFLASRGYAVFQPNYRGSTGYAWRFPESDMWDFRKMHDDVTDGVKTVLKTGVIDKDRIAIMGGSFGGYLSLCGAVYEKNLYRCAITIAGVFDWELMIKEAKGSEYARSNYGVLRRFLGDPKKNEEKFDDISPLRHVDQIKIPVFVAHGTEDKVASAEQSKVLLSEFKKHGVAFEKQIERGEGHGFRKLDNQVELYTAIEAFLAKHMAPRAHEAAANQMAPAAVAAVADVH